MLIGVYGASGFGREVLPLVRTQSEVAELVFIDDSPKTPAANGHRILRWDEFLCHPASDKFVSLAISNSQVRRKLSSRCEDNGIQIIDVFASNSVLLDDVKIGSGAIICPFVTITSNVRIGIHFHANIYSYIAHDCTIGDFVTFAPSVKCNGNVQIEDHAYIGTGAILKQGHPTQPLVIGRGAVIGMGAVVTKSVPPGVTVVGNPAKPLVKA